MAATCCKETRSSSFFDRKSKQIAIPVAVAQWKQQLNNSGGKRKHVLWGKIWPHWSHKGSCCSCLEVEIHLTLMCVKLLCANETRGSLWAGWEEESLLQQAEASRNIQWKISRKWISEPEFSCWNAVVGLGSGSQLKETLMGAQLEEDTHASRAQGSSPEDHSWWVAQYCTSWDWGSTGLHQGQAK